MSALEQERQHSLLDEDVEFSLALAEAYQKKGDSASLAAAIKWAENARQFATGQSLAVAEKALADVKAYQAIAKILEKAGASFAAGKYEDMLAGLLEAEPRYPGRSDLREWREARTREAIADLMSQARKEANSGKADGLIAAAAIYARVTGLEAQAGLRAAGQVKSPAEQELDGLGAQIPDFIDKVCLDAGRFQYGASAAEALARAQTLVLRLQAFLRLVDRAPGDKARLENNLKERLRQMQAHLTTLESLNELLQQARPEEEAWQKALTTGDFQEMHGLYKQAFGLSQAAKSMPEVQAFEKRLSESSARRAELSRSIEQLKAVLFQEQKFDQALEICAVLRGPAYAALLPYAHNQFGVKDAVNEFTHYDSMLGRNVETLDEYERLAQQRKDDLERWEPWAKRSDETYNSILAEKKIIEDGKTTLPIGELRVKLESALRLTASAQNWLSHPPESALSRLTERMLRESRNWLAEIPEMEKEFQRLRADLDAREQGVPHLLIKANAAMKNRDRKEALLRLNEILALDPGHDWAKAQKAIVERWPQTPARPSRMR